MYRATIFLTILALLATSASAQKPSDEARLGPGLSLTVYNKDLAVIKERRLMELPRGREVVKFAKVAARIIPQTVQFSSLSYPGDTKVVEFDIATTVSFVRALVTCQLYEEQVVCTKCLDERDHLVSEPNISNDSEVE